MPCLPDKITSIGLDIGSVNCGIAVINIWTDTTIQVEGGAGSVTDSLNIECVGGGGYSVPGGIRATSGARIELVDSMIGVLEPNVEVGSIIGIEGFTNQQY